MKLSRKPARSLDFPTLLVLGALAALLALAPGRATEFSFTPSGVQGGGGLTVIAESPTQPGLLASGGDNSGIHVSSDDGRTWQARNLGFTELAHMSVAAIEFGPGTSAFAAVGNGDAGLSAVFMTEDITDLSVPWLNIAAGTPAASITFSGQHNGASFPAPAVYSNREPRSTGKLLVYQEDCFPLITWCLFAGSLDQGVYVWWQESSSSTIDAKHLAFPASAPESYIRSLAYDPMYQTLYAGTLHAGVQRLALVLGGVPGTLEPVLSEEPSLLCPVATPAAEELLLHNETLYIAAGPAGVFKATRSGATFFCDTVPIYPASCEVDAACAGPYWRSLAARDVGGRTELYIGSIEAEALGSPVEPHAAGSTACSVGGLHHDAIIMTPDVATASSWETLMRNSTTDPCSPKVLGTTNTWWRSDESFFIESEGRNVSNAPGRSSFHSAALHVSRHSTTGQWQLFSAGSAGIQQLSLSPLGLTTWQPAVHGMQATQGLLVHTNELGDETWLGVRDYFGMKSDGLLQTIESWSPAAAPTDPQLFTDYLDEMNAAERHPLPADAHKIYFGALDTNVGDAQDPWIISCDDSSTELSACEVVAHRDAAAADDPAYLCDGAWQVGALAAGVDADGNEKLFAAVMRQKNGDPGDCQGVYQFDGTSWELQPNSADEMERPFTNYSVSMEWFGGSSPLYLYNRDTGLHSMEPPLYNPLPANTGTNFKATRPFSGFMVASKLDMRVYVSVDDTLYGISPTGVVEVTFTTPATVGPIAWVEPGLLATAVPASASHSADLCLIDVSDPTSPTRDCFGDAVYRNGVLFPTSIARIDHDAPNLRIAVSTLAGGFFVAERLPADSL